MKRRRQLPRIFILIDSLLLLLVIVTAVISYDVVHDLLVHDEAALSDNRKHTG